LETPELLFFPEPRDWRQWLEANHDQCRELWVGFHKVGSGQPSITWPEAVDQALCFGWIDGIRKRVNETSYKIRFTPRKPSSNWSAVNIKRVDELTALGLMQPAGLRAFAARTEEKSGINSYEQRKSAQLDPAGEASFQSNPQAWAWFQSQPPGYRQNAIWWVVSAKQEATRARRLATLIDDCEHERTIRPLTRPGS
jgi:uncharacterized protein YdeI (YjbR/CyaY-like superfamily)